ncbi:hypothetical protein [Halochromatium glycolicum]|uniref:Uncharacterized protein n=1 Tax=Halochromatium glycolicum TaxID=85075 RepID=A0AAJ0U6C2_9GAMM|nr:hypothetical protein [Halochromatium glycolicum]MBK1706081.1 hypothetical protein [Halochromatium glycolicum]
MHIDDLINEIRPHIPFWSEKSAQRFIEKFNEDDRIALVSALYFGRSHLHLNEVNDDHMKYLRSGEMNRFWDKDCVEDDEIARVLYEKNTNLTAYYDAFLRCTTNSNYDRSNY